MEQSSLSQPLPLAPLEHFLRQCESSRTSMVIRAVYRFTGDCDRALFRAALSDAIARHPLLNCRLSGQGQKLYWIPGNPGVVSERQVAGSVHAPEILSLAQEINLKSSPGFRCELQHHDDGVKAVVDTHHAVIDGNGLRQLITDWLHLYDCRMTGRPSRLTDYETDRLSSRHIYPSPISGEPIPFRESVRNLWFTVRGRTARWKRVSAAVSPGITYSHCLERIITESQASKIQESLDAWRVSFNDLMIVACMTVFAASAPQLNSRHNVTVLNPIDLRRPSDRFLSATNRFGAAFLRRKVADCQSPEELIPGIHGEMDYVRNNYIGAEFVRGLDSALRIPGGLQLFHRSGLFTPSLQWTCLGDFARGWKRYMTWHEGAPCPGGLKLLTMTGFAPFAEGVPISISTCEINRRTTLAVRSSPFHLTMEQTELFADSLLHQLCHFRPPQS